MHIGSSYRRHAAAIAGVVAATLASSSVLAGTTDATTSGSGASSASAVNGRDANNDAAQLQEVVVTAQRRSENIQQTPLAISAFSAAELGARQLNSIASLATTVPGLNVTEQSGEARITVRGIGFDSFSAGTEAAVNVNVDGIVYSRPASALGGLYDINRVEVVRGPQGTLYGRNATAGAINIITNAPTDTLQGNFELTGGNYGTLNSEGAISGPITKTVSGRLSEATEDHKGYGRNLVTGTDVDNRHTRAVRGQLLLKPTSRLSVLLEADYFTENDHSAGFHLAGGAGETAPGVPEPLVGPTFPGNYIAPNLRDIASGMNPTYLARFYGGHAELTYKLNDTMSFTSLTGLRVSDHNTNGDLGPAGPVVLIETRNSEESTEDTQEFRVNIDTQRNKFVAGLFYLHEYLVGANFGTLNALLFHGPDFFTKGVDIAGRLKTDAAAAYLQDDLDILRNLTLTLGERFSWERKAVNDQDLVDIKDPFDPTAPLTSPHRVDSHIWRASTPKIGLKWQATPSTMLYVSYSEGFKSGDYNIGNFAPPVQPEKVKAVEAGLKTTVFHDRFRANISGFHYDYTNLQVFKTIGTSLVEENAATATIYGVDGDFALKPFAERSVLLTLDTEWLHARFDNYFSVDPARPHQGNAIDPATGKLSFNLSGNSLEQAPDYTVTLAVQDSFTFPLGNLTLRAESAWTGRVYFTQFNQPSLMQRPVEMANAYVNFVPNDHPYYINLYVKNIGNKLVESSGTAATQFLGAPADVYLKPPRTYGITVGVHF